jgi:MFS family permease
MDRRALAVLVACFCTVFTAFSIRYGYGVLLPEMLPSLAISKTSAGIIYSSYFIAYTILAPVLGMMADRYNTRAILTLFTAVLGVGAILMAYASSVVEASLYFTLAGIGTSACWAPVMALAQRWVSARRRGTALALIDTGSSFGIVWMAAVIPVIVVNYNWPAGWMALGSLGLLVAGINFVIVRNPPPQQQLLRPETGQANDESFGVTFRRLLRDTRFWLIGLAYLLTGFSILIPFTFLSTYAVQELAFPYEVATRLLTVIGIGAVVGKLALGSLSDKVGRLRIMILCKVLIAAGTLGMMYAQGFLAMASFTVVFSLGYGTVWAMYAAAASDYFSRELAGSIVGLWTMYLGIGSVLSPIIAGWVADTTGTLAWSFLLAAAGALVALLLLLLVRWGVFRQPSRSSVTESS